MIGASASAQTIAAGCDCYETEVGTKVDIPTLPQGFFGNNGGFPSDPLTPGGWPMRGEPLPSAVVATLCPNSVVFETIWVDQHGTPVSPDDVHKVGQVHVATYPNIDSVVCRPGATPVPPVGGSAPVPIELVELSLVSVNPITVTYNGGNPTQWNVIVTENGPSPGGLMTITTTGQVPGAIQGGMTLGTLPVQYQISFQEISGAFPPTSAISGNLVFTERTPGVPTRGNWQFFLGGAGIPTMAEWSLMLLAVVLLGAGVFVMRRRKLATS
jgi:hypothetical protein